MDTNILVEDTNTHPQVAPDIDEAGIGDASLPHVEVTNLARGMRACMPPSLPTCICALVCLPGP